MRLPVLCALGSLALLAASAAIAAGHDQLAPNAIVTENARPGSGGWLAPFAPDRTIEGYTSEDSVEPGGTVNLHVSAEPAARYRIVVYRLGWYGGAGARLLMCLPGCAADELGAPRPVPPPDPVTGEVRAGWPVTDALAIPDDWVSGYYAAQLLLTTGPRRGSAKLVPFVVRAGPTDRSAILVQVPVNTWQAYNGWGGKSLYNFSSTGNVPAFKVSFDRPYSWHTTHSQPLSNWELPLMRFLEREGYDVSYQTDVDSDRTPASLLDHRLVIAAGHGEYWTKGQRDGFEAARAAGTNLAFLGANTAYWQVRYEDGGRTIVGYKSLADPIADPAQKTALFRELTPSRLECRLEGVQHQGGLLDWPAADYAVNPVALDDPWFANTGFDASSTVVNALSIERDTIPHPDTQPPGVSCGHRVTVFFHHGAGGDTIGNGDAVGYRTRSGSRVFASGSLQFVWALDSFRGVPPDNSVPFVTPVDPRLQEFVRNMLADLTQAAPARLHPSKSHRPSRRTARRPRPPRR